MLCMNKCFFILYRVSVFKFTFVVILALMLTSCAHNIHISHNAYANSKAIPQGFKTNSSFAVGHVTGESSMLSQEVAHKIECILASKGHSVQSEKLADYKLVFDYDMTQSKKTVYVDEYIPGKTITTYGSTYDHGHTQLYEEKTQESGKIVSVPEVRTYFNKSLMLQVYDAQYSKAYHKQAPLWQGSAACSDQEDDLRDALDYLLVTAFKSFGRNTQKNLEITVSSDDKDVAVLRSELFCSTPR